MTQRVSKILLKAALTFGLFASMATPCLAGDRPEWIDHPPKDADYVYFVGTSSPSISEQIGRAESRQDGLRQLAESFGVTASVYFRSSAKSSSRDTNDTLVSYSDRVQVKGLEFERTYVSDNNGLKTVFTLLRISRPAYEEERKRLASAEALKVDLSSSLQRLTADLSQAQSTITRLCVGEVKASWPSDNSDPIIAAVHEELLATLARSGKWTVLTQVEADVPIVQTSLSLSKEQALVVTLTVRDGERLVWASQPYAIDAGQLPAGLQVHLTNVIRLEAIGAANSLLTSIEPVVFSVGIVGINKNQYDVVYKALTARTDVKSVAKTYYKEGFGKLEIQAVGTLDTGRESINSALESCGLSLINHKDNNLIFKQQ